MKDVLAWQWGRYRSDLPKGPWLLENKQPTPKDYALAFPLHQLDRQLIASPPGVSSQPSASLSPPDKVTVIGIQRLSDQDVIACSKGAAGDMAGACQRPCTDGRPLNPH